MALAGGVNLTLTPEMNVVLSKARMMAADGRCKTFDAAADGYVRGEGCGIVVPPGAVAPVRDALVRLAGDSRQRQAMGEAARARVAAFHTTDDLAAAPRLLSPSGGAGV